MSCMIANLQGGRPEIFPIPIDRMRALTEDGMRSINTLLGGSVSSLKPTVHQYTGAALRPDRSPFYLTTVAPDYSLEMTRLPWRGAFFAPFGIGNIVGEVESAPDDQTVMLRVSARLMVNDSEHVAVEWEIIGTQVTAPNKSSLIHSIKITNPGPHDPADIRRCVALHAPERVFGEPRAIVSMQCGVAAAACLEAIC